ncbi:unnamed protein product [Ixodes pacificus]
MTKKTLYKKFQGRRMYDNRLHSGHTETHRTAAQMNGAPAVANRRFQVHVRFLKQIIKWSSQMATRGHHHMCFRVLAEPMLSGQ